MMDSCSDPGRRLSAVPSPTTMETSLPLVESLAPAVTLRVYGRGDDPVSVVLEFRDIPSQVTIASSARTLVGVVSEPSLSSTAVTMLTDDASRIPGRPT